MFEMGRPERACVRMCSAHGLAKFFKVCFFLKVEGLNYSMGSGFRVFSTWA